MKIQKVHEKHSELDEPIEKGVEKLIKRNKNDPEFYYQLREKDQIDVDLDFKMMTAKINFIKSQRYAQIKSIGANSFDKENTMNSNPIKTKNIGETAIVNKTSDNIVLSSKKLSFLINPDNLEEKSTQVLTIVNADNNLRRIRYIPLKNDTFKITKTTYPSPGSSEIAPGNSLILEIEFCAKGFLKESSEILYFASETTKFEVVLESVCPAPELHFPRMVDFENCFIGDEIELALDVINIGIKDQFSIEFEHLTPIEGEDDVFTIIPKKFQLAYNDQIKLKIAFKPKTNKKYNATMKIFNQNTTFQGNVCGYGETLELVPIIFDRKKLKPSEAVVFNSILFSDFQEETIYKKSLVLKNFNKIEINFDISIQQSQEERFSISPEVGKILPGQELEFTFKFDSSVYQKSLFAQIDFNLLNVPVQSLQTGLFKSTNQKFKFFLEAHPKKNRMEFITTNLENKEPFYINKANFLTTQIKIEGRGVLGFKILNEYPECELLVDEFGVQNDSNSIRLSKVNAKIFNAKTCQKDDVLNIKFCCYSVKPGKYEFTCEAIFQEVKKSFLITLNFESLHLSLNTTLIDFKDIPLTMKVDFPVFIENRSNVQEKIIVLMDRGNVPSLTQIMQIFKLNDQDRKKELENKKNWHVQSEVNIQELFHLIPPLSSSQLTFSAFSKKEIIDLKRSALIISESNGKIMKIDFKGSFQNLDLSINYPELNLDSLTVLKEHVNNQLVIQNTRNCATFWRIVSEQNQKATVVFRENSGVVSGFEFIVLRFSALAKTRGTFSTKHFVYFDFCENFEISTENSFSFNIIFNEVADFPIFLFPFKGPLLYLNESNHPKVFISEEKIESNKKINSKLKIEQNQSSLNNLKIESASIIPNQTSKLLDVDVFIKQNDVNLSKIILNDQNLQVPISQPAINSKNTSQISFIDENEKTKNIEKMDNSSKLSSEKVFTIEKEKELTTINICQEVLKPYIKKFLLKNESDQPILIEIDCESHALQFECGFLSLLKLFKDNHSTQLTENLKISKKQTDCLNSLTHKNETSLKHSNLKNYIKCQFHSPVKYQVHEKPKKTNFYQTECNFNSEEGYMLHMERNIRMFFESQEERPKKQTIALSHKKVHLLPNSSVEILFSIHSKELENHFVDSLQIKMDSTIVKKIPIFASFFGQNFEILETQIYLRTMSNDYKILSFKKSENTVTHALKFKNKTQDTLKLYFGIVNLLDDIIEVEKEEPVTNQIDSMTKMDQCENETAIRLEKEMKQLKKQTLLKSVLSNKTKDDSVQRSIYSMDLNAIHNKFIDLDSSKKLAGQNFLPGQIVQVRFEENYETGVFDMIIDPFLQRKEKTSFSIQSGDVLIGPQKTIEFKVSCSFGIENEEAVLLISEKRICNENQNYTAIKLKTVG